MMLTRVTKNSLKISSWGFRYLVRNGYGDRGASCDCDGAGWRYRRHSQDLDIAEQAEEVRRVKRFEAGMVVNPITITPDRTLADALALMDHHKISGIPVVSKRTRKHRWNTDKSRRSLRG